MRDAARSGAAYDALAESAFLVDQPREEGGRQAGIFGDDASGIDNGLTAFDSAATVPAKEGVHVEMQCRACGRPVRVTAEWGEMIAVKYNVPAHIAFQGTPFVSQPPTQWFFSKEQEAWCPMNKCRTCNELCSPGFKPDEAEKHLSVARRNGWFAPNFETPASTRASQTAAAMAQHQRR